MTVFKYDFMMILDNWFTFFGHPL